LSEVCSCNRERARRITSLAEALPPHIRITDRELSVDHGRALACQHQLLDGLGEGGLEVQQPGPPDQSRGDPRSTP
jgi:hypothetical protein